ncbi:hypothetical protein GT030_07095 [Streptomyces sp. SID1328]|uniref:hypothetical protein n=1 Tax=Streptomyces sp. SID1328 TaxID=2690250 RepID=UPI0013720658|nr:hypothetical protein [Streptomyces sp. SID1328]MYV38642.1 hypothetical protein [Streptomyces sp. SID1328]
MSFDAMWCQARNTAAARQQSSMAHDPSVESALTKIAGTDRFSDHGSEPEEALATLRASDGEVGAFGTMGVPNCRLRPASGGDQLVTIYFREAVVILKANSESDKTSTYYRTGASAASEERVSSIYFHCRMAKPKKDIIVNARLERESKVKISGREAADNQMIVANAAARSVAQQLGCQGTGLSTGAPKAISGVYGPH